MAAQTRQTNTQSEILRKLLSSFTELKLAEDADFDWIAEEEARIIGKLREPYDMANQNMQAQGLTGAAPPEMMGGGMGQELPMVGGPPPMAGPGGDPNLDMLMQAIMGGQGGATPGAVPGAMPPGRGPTMSPDMPSPDELRRVIGQGQGL